jgi:hypothetical protein
MTRPGDRLRAFARRFCAADTMTRIVDPLIADLQHDDASAANSGRACRARRRLAGYAAFWTTLTICATRASSTGVRRWASADDHAIGRTLAFSSMIAAGLVVLLALLPFYAVVNTNRVAPHEFGRLFLVLIPQAIPLALAFGLPLGILVGLRGRSIKRRVRRNVRAICVVSAAAAFPICAWVLPETNQAFREAVVGRGRPPLRGANELSFPELRSRLAVLNAAGRPDEMRPYLYSYHARLASSAAPFIWGLFALTLASVTRRTLLSTAIVVAAGVCYIACATFIINGNGADTFAGMPLPYLIWMPNGLFTLMTFALWMTTGRSAPASLG